MTSVLSLTGLPALAAASNDGETVTVTGIYRLIATSPDPDSTHTVEHELHFIETENNELVQLHVDDESELEQIQPGSELSVTGTETDGVGGEGLDVAEITVEEDPEIAAAPSNGQLKTAVILLQKGENGAKPTNPEELKKIYFTNPDSVREYFLESSWSSLSLTGSLGNTDGDVYDYITIPENTGCWDEVAAGNVAAHEAGINLDHYDMISYVMDGASAPGCGYAGWAYVGGREHINLYYSLMTGAFPGIVRHEIGHNLGLHHANSLTCTKDGAQVALPGAGVSCTSTEYGDSFDTMGNSGSGFHFSALNKSRLGWIGPHKITEVTRSATYSLAPRTVKVGGSAQLLKVKLGEPLEDYYIEYRQPYGTYWETGDKAPATLSGVQIRRVTPGDKTEIIKANPSASGNAAYPLSADQGTFIDPATGTKITVTSAGGPLATVRVQLPDVPFQKHFDRVYLRGTHNDWGTSTQMELIDNNIWEIKANFGNGNNERFKFDINGDWSNNFGDNNNDQVADYFGADIQITDGDGEYTITWNDLSRKYTVVKTPVPNQEPVIITTPDTNLKTPTQVPVTFDASDSYDPDGTIVSYEWSFGSERSFDPTWTKTFTNPGIYSVNLIIEDNDGARVGKSISVQVTEEPPYLQAHPQVYLRGTHNSWSTDTEMRLVGNHKWVAIVNFTGNTNERFKFDIDGDWSHNYGDNNNDGIADYFGADIQITQGPGEYMIVWNDLSQAYTVQKFSSAS